MSFHNPQLLWLLLLLIPWALLRRRQAGRTAALKTADETSIASLPDTLRAHIARSLPYLRLMILALSILALARPQTVEREIEVRSKGADLVVALDLSTSMLAEDLQGVEPRKNRLAMAKEVLADFIRGRSGDRIGLIAFAARPYPAAPLTLDHAWLQAAVARLESGAIEDGTALGDALLTALNRLRTRPADGLSPPRAANRVASQAVILITDGRNNAGTASTQLAAAAARTLGVRVHAIGIGSRGQAVIPMEDPLGGTLYRQVQLDLDESVLREIAAATGGRYFRADDHGSLEQVFREIDQLEKRPIEEKVHFTYRELFPAVLLGVLALLLLEQILRATWLRTFP